MEILQSCTNPSILPFHQVLQYRNMFYVFAFTEVYCSGSDRQSLSIYLVAYHRNIYFDGLVQERRNSIANTLEFRLSCTNPSIYWWYCFSCGSYSNECLCLLKRIDLSHQLDTILIYIWCLFHPGVIFIPHFSWSFSLLNIFSGT